jgi:hypothetical protein
VEQTLGDLDHLIDNVDSRDVLSDGMLDLQTRVHLQEVEVLARVNEELHGTWASSMSSSAGGSTYIPAQRYPAARARLTAC